MATAVTKHQVSVYSACVLKEEQENKQVGGNRQSCFTRAWKHSSDRASMAPRPQRTLTLGNPVSGEQENGKEKWNRTGRTPIRLLLIQ